MARLALLGLIALLCIVVLAASQESDYVYWGELFHLKLPYSNILFKTCARRVSAPGWDASVDRVDRVASRSSRRSRTPSSDGYSNPPDYSNPLSYRNLT